MSISLRKLNEKGDWKSLSKYWKMTKEELHKAKNDFMVAIDNQEIIGGLHYYFTGNGGLIASYEGKPSAYGTAVDFLQTKIKAATSKSEITLVVEDTDEISHILPCLKEKGFAIKLEPRPKADVWICTWSKK
jgi:hypothetical protein